MKRTRSRSSDEVLADSPRCIYCEAPAATVEHMPPKMIFRAKDRPSGMEYPSCFACNNGTSAADAAVSFFARIDRFNSDLAGWKMKEALKPLRSLGTLAPGFFDEFFNEDAVNHTLLKTPGGILAPVAEMHTGPISQALLTVFTAKLGMALYREHTGTPLPLDGGVHTMWFLNNGLSEEVAHGVLSILPTHSTLRQGRHKSATGQFDYRFNSDDKGIVAALTHFHGNIHFFTLSMADPAHYGFPMPMPFTALVKPGELLKFMPKKPLAIFMPTRPELLKSDWLILPKSRV